MAHLFRENYRAFGKNYDSSDIRKSIIDYNNQVMEQFFESQTKTKLVQQK